MDLNIQRLLKNLEENTQEILGKIHQDPKLTKRKCPVTGLFIANASKDLFTPEHVWQLYAKGIVYELSDNYEFRLVSLPLLKMYNFGENQDVVTHVNEMISIGARPVYLPKLDGTNVNRFIYKGQVYLSTRGMIETMVENDEQAQYFNWAHDIIDRKYPQIMSNKYLNDRATAIFELTGPENRIVTHYPQWDLSLLSISHFDDNNSIREKFGLNKFLYSCYEDASNYSSEFNFGKTNYKLYIDENIDLREGIKEINKLFENTDDEGSVIQFELKNPETGINVVVGRVKAKTENYRSLLKLMKSCNYDTIAEIIEKEDFKCYELDKFTNYLKKIGNETFPEELMETYVVYWNEHWDYISNVEKLLNYVYFNVAKIFDENNIKFDYNDSNIPVLTDTKERKNFAETINRDHKNLAYFFFAASKGELTYDLIKSKLDRERLKEIINEIR